MLRVGFDQGLAQAFTTAAGPDVTAPTLASARAGLYQEVEYGCGPSRSVPIALAALHESPMRETLARATPAP